ncbi:hypothetical protein BDW74DRAFT_157354 [Aspergillus multicolor]|uniref:uncharacterized protein n=1 Tax=Aspergillus multicolor TaxID=41759 RepID=UPI003CCD8712
MSYNLSIAIWLGPARSDPAHLRSFAPPRPEFWYAGPILHLHYLNNKLGLGRTGDKPTRGFSNPCDIAWPWCG